MMMRRTVAAAAVAGALALGTAGVAQAYTMDEAGYGWVGKGEVQTPFGWNNKALQDNAAGVTFYLESSATYEATCTWTTGEGTRGEQTHNVDIPRHTAVVADVNAQTRTNSKGKDGPVTGWYLQGFGATSTDGEVPVVGGPCVGDKDATDGKGQDGTWTAVELTGVVEGGLYASFGGTSHLLTLDVDTSTTL